MQENRMIEIEIKLSHQEHTIDSLNKIVSKQEVLIYQLEEKMEKLIKELRDRNTDDKHKKATNEPPPHY